MALDKEHLEYPERHYGMDHKRYSWSMLQDRPKVQWPEGKSVALWVNVCLQYFPLNQQGKPFKVPGGMTMPYPDLRHYSLRDYGNRVGIYRFFEAFDRYGIKPTVAMNTRLAEKYPYLLDKVLKRGDEIICHGYHMDALHHDGLSAEDEVKLVKQSVDTLRQLTGQSVSGWLSPARNESQLTPEFLAQNNIRYFCDWVNDDMPYTFNTESGSLVAMPLSNELDDQFILMNNLHSEQSYVEQIEDACELLLKEAETSGGRILALNIHPWLLGQPHRIAKLEGLLERLSSHPKVWSASASDILEAFENQQVKA